MASVDFRSDNTLGCSPEIVEAIARASTGSVSSYGHDEITSRVRQRLRDLFESDLEVFPLATGTGANCLAIAAVTPSWGAVFCHEDAHIQRDEFGAPEFFTTGAKLIPIAGGDGKLHAAELARVVDDVGESGRMAIPSCVSVTQATEAGTVYQPDELRQLTDIAHARGCAVHMDGARFTNALVSIGCSPADLTWRAGVDLLVFGATKNGAMAADFLICFRKELSDVLTKRIHRAGQRFSKMRFLSAQFEAYLTDDLWLRNARRANATARQLASGLREAGAEILRPVEANIIFVRLREGAAAALQSQGFNFYDWPIFGPGAVRLVTGFSTTDEQVAAFVEAYRRLAGS